MSRRRRGCTTECLRTDSGTPVERRLNRLAYALVGSGGAEKDAALELQLIGGVRLFFGNTVQAARTSPLIRRIIHEAFEHASEVGLSTKAYSQGDLGKRQIGLAQKMLGP